MGATITVKSEMSVGSTFTVHLPQVKVGSVVLGEESVENLQLFRRSSRAQMKRVQIAREPMPYGSVLIVDDVETNIYVAEGLLAPYGLRVDKATSGFEAIEMIKSGMVYDIVFMDHMMPVMDGIEATRIIRELGYTEAIVALTANAISGAAEMFLRSGFNDFISKPIDIRQLNAVLNTLIRDKQSPEVIMAARALMSVDEATAGTAPAVATNAVAGTIAEQFTEKVNTIMQLPGAMARAPGTMMQFPGSITRAPGTIMQIPDPMSRTPNTALQADGSIPPRFAEAFIRDANRSLYVLEALQEKWDMRKATGQNAYDEGDMSLFITNVHGMKSALANVGEAGLSAVAAILEQVARSGDSETMQSMAPKFLNSLHMVVNKLAPKKDGVIEKRSDSDAALLHERLIEIKTACASFNENRADALLVELRKKTWAQETDKLLDDIALYLLHCDFDEIVQAIQKFLGAETSTVKKVLAFT